MHPMKKFLIVSTLALAALAVRAELPQPDLLAQIHFAGGDRIAANKNYPAFANEFSSAEALALRQQVADKLAPWLSKNLNVAAGGAALRPLLDDLQSAEWFFEARAGQGGKTAAALAIKLAPTRAQLWQTELQFFFPAATFKQSGGWLIFDSGSGALKLGEKLAQKTSAPATNWLTADVNWPRLAQWQPQLKTLGLPETTFEGSADATNLLVTGKFFFPENLTLKQEAWRFPTNTVHLPFFSFTAVRGLMGWLKTQPWGEAFAVDTAEDQTFIWCGAGEAFQAFAAVPVASSRAALQQASGQLQAVVAERNAQNGFMTPMRWQVTNNEVALIGAPGISPYLKAMKESSGEFLLAGGLPHLARGKPTPPELIQHLTAPGMVFYHWEDTAQRLKAQLQLDQISFLMTRHKQINGAGVPYQWISKFAPELRATVTEITQTAPDQLTFKRRAPGGLTAFEFLLLATWLDAPDFPGCNLQLPPPSDRLKKMRER
ncbi:MAG: hypothetical protein RL616_607, partial [Verrucomicrobiota bacterium]